MRKPDTSHEIKSTTSANEPAVLLILHPSFEDSEIATRDAWLNLFSDELSRSEVRAIRFNPRTTCLREFKVAHVFSWDDPELWKSLQEAGLSVIVTPGYQAPPPLSSFTSNALRVAVSVARGLTQRKWPPLEDSRFFAGADHYLVPGTQWGYYLQRSLGVDPAHIAAAPANAVAFARSAALLYGKVSSQKETG